MTTLWIRFTVLAAITAAAGYAIAEASIGLVNSTDIGAGPVGTIFAGVSTSLPELVTAIASVRAGAVSLAIGNILGGNAFDVMFLAAADVASPEPIYRAITPDNLATAIIAILMTSILLLGMLKRDRHGGGGIGFESNTVIGLYILSVVILFV